MARQRNKGFILTMELVFLITIVGLVILIFVFQYLSRNRLFDSTDKVIGRAKGYDLFEAPLVRFWIDNGTAKNLVVLGVRTDRFTSRSAVYFDAANCTGNPFVPDPSGYIYELQGVAYGMGGNVNLYRQQTGATPGTFLVTSMWVSQNETINPPCINFAAANIASLAQAELALALPYAPPFRLVP